MGRGLGQWGPWRVARMGSRRQAPWWVVGMGQRGSGNGRQGLGGVGNGPARGEMDRWGPQPWGMGLQGPLNGPAGDGEWAVEGRGPRPAAGARRWGNRPARGEMARRWPRRAVGSGVAVGGGQHGPGRAGNGQTGPEGLQKVAAARVTVGGSAVGTTVAADGREGGGVAREGQEREGHFIAGFTTLEEEGRPPAGGFPMLNVDNGRGGLYRKRHPLN